MIMHWQALVLPRIIRAMTGVALVKVEAGFVGKATEFLNLNAERIAVVSAGEGAGFFYRRGSRHHDAAVIRDFEPALRGTPPEAIDVRVVAIGGGK